MHTGNYTDTRIIASSVPSGWKGYFPTDTFPLVPPVVPKPFWLKDPEKESSPLPRGLLCAAPGLHSMPISGGIQRGGRLSRQNWSNLHPDFTHYGLIFCFRKCCQKSEMASLEERLPDISSQSWSLGVGTRNTLSDEEKHKVCLCSECQCWQLGSHLGDQTEEGMLQGPETLNAW